MTSNYTTASTQQNYLNAYNLITRYGYDGFGRQIAVTDTLNHVTRSYFDPAGRLISTTLPNGVQSVNGYDVAGRLVNLTHNGPYWTLAAYTYTLDAVGNRLAVMERVLPPTPFTYLPVILKDFAGSGEQMLPGEQSSPFASPLATPAPFDSPLLPTSSLPPHSAAVPVFDPSLLIIAPVALAAVVASRKGRKWALLVAVLTGALVVVGQTHTRASGASPAPMPFLSPGSVPPGCTLPTALGDTRVISYTYDPLYRLNQAAYFSGECYQYAYDRVGNRTVMTTTVGTTTYQYDPANRLTNAGGVNYTWDNNGNLINDGSALYRYDRANRLISTTLNSTTSLFNYNGDGVRLKQIVTGTVTTYTQDVAAPLPVVLQAKTSVTTTKYLYSLGTRPLAQSSAAWEYLLPDALGSVRQIANANGYIIRTQDYEPYGSLLNSGGNASSMYDFTGEERDQSGLIFLRARYMQPRLGIFLARDPWEGDVLRPGSMNGFGYVEGNPVNALDPSGLYSGEKIHALIQAKFEVTWGLGHIVIPEFYVKGGSKQGLDLVTAGALGQPGFGAYLKGTPTGNPGYIDIADLTARQAYEIKPEDEAINGIAEIGWYVTTYNANPDSRVRFLVPGTTYSIYPEWELIGTNPYYQGQDIIATLRANGVIVYRVVFKDRLPPELIWIWVFDEASQTYKRQQRQLAPAYADNAALWRAGEVAAITTFLYGCYNVIRWGFEGYRCVSTGVCQFSPR